MTTLREMAGNLIDKSKGLMNLVVRSTFTELDDFERIDENDLAMIKEVNNVMEEAGDYLKKESRMLDDMSEQLENLQEQMKEMIRKQNILLEKVERRRRSPNKDSLLFA